MTTSGGTTRRRRRRRAPDGFVDVGSTGHRIPLARLVAILWFASLLAIIAVGVGHYLTVRVQLADHELDRARTMTDDRATMIIQPAITPELLAGDPDAYAAFDEIVRGDALQADTGALTLWTTDGRIVYSLDESLVGRSFDLPPRVDAVIAGSDPSAQVGVLDGPDESTAAWAEIFPAIEVYTGIDGPDGERLIWEADLHRDGITERANQLLASVTVSEVAGAALLLTGQGILGLSLVRRHERERQYRSWLMGRVSEVALVERRRIAADLHDGVVQDFTGIALDLEVPPATAHVSNGNGNGDGASHSNGGRGGSHREGEGRRHIGTTDDSGRVLVAHASDDDAWADRAEMAARMRTAIAALRAQTTEIYPAGTYRDDLPSGLRTLVDRIDPAPEKFIEIDDDAVVVPEYRWLVLRVAQEALRNAKLHSQATKVTVELRPEDEFIVLTVDDNGVGFVPETTPVEPGHMGLALLTDMAAAAGGSLTIRSAVGAGTTVRLEVPA